ncbi:multidrug effflux MFS transporter [Staphylococcus simiae]|uniref:multidrug effflux MFS transporter n=1 Tax=Staphylococcus simiae TaxID=308354 RepID=UPI001A968FD6|nr:multidrug effflux MFS transporter [Staphylococcus simiae]MBO1198553.1 multidrug effflux MFS transporter [Staphylococcus simiae]MBO1200649.1 multidrug effflux MFS transporter [Staphylococcus simiae]MBO1202959.1 multidrug effflux MFS transporter [Staphylococcus simiae]MBO1210544.1 multidrug effflux MFS transporter [Staphylococcus simiae]MBO1229025.1 multidrug effflux MFS transporter [Staphylococcus simiae]
MIMSSAKSKHFSLLLLITLGVMTAFGPLTIDMYVPSLPKVQNAFSSTTSEIQLTLSFTMIGLALGQFIFGPLSDALGRKRVAVSILIIFVITSFIAIVTTHLYLFLILRLIQGLTGGGAIVIAKASVGDKFSGNELAKFLASLMVINGIITILAPLAGGWALSMYTWRTIFTILTVISLIILIGVASQLPKTPKHELKQVNFNQVFKDFGSLLKKPGFIIPMLLQGLTYVMLFSFSSASPFITQKLYNMTPQQFSVMFSVNGIGLIVVSQIVALLVEKMHRHFLLILLTMIQVTGVILIVITLVFHLPLWLLLVAFFLNVCPVTSIGPLGFTMAMEERTGGSGNASSLLGLFQFILGGLIAPLVGLKGQYDTTPYIVIIVMTAVALITLQMIYFKMINKQSA